MVLRQRSNTFIMASCESPTTLNDERGYVEVIVSIPPGLNGRHGRSKDILQLVPACTGTQLFIGKDVDGA